MRSLPRRRRLADYVHRRGARLCAPAAGQQISATSPGRRHTSRRSRNASLSEKQWCPIGRTDMREEWPPVGRRRMWLCCDCLGRDVEINRSNSHTTSRTISHSKPTIETACSARRRRSSFRRARSARAASSSGFGVRPSRAIDPLSMKFPCCTAEQRRKRCYHRRFDSRLGAWRICVAAIRHVLGPICRRLCRSAFSGMTRAIAEFYLTHLIQRWGDYRLASVA